MQMTPSKVAISCPSTKYAVSEDKGGSGKQSSAAQDSGLPKVVIRIQGTALSPSDTFSIHQGTLFMFIVAIKHYTNKQVGIRYPAI